MWTANNWGINEWNLDSKMAAVNEKKHTCKRWKWIWMNNEYEIKNKTQIKIYFSFFFVLFLLSFPFLFIFMNNINLFICIKEFNVCSITFMYMQCN